MAWKVLIVTKKTVMQSLSPLKKIMYVFLLQPLFVACSSSKEGRVIVHGWNLCSESLNKKGGSVMFVQMEGSVDEESARSDEGDVDYMDEIDHDDGYWSYDMDEVTPPTVLPADHIGADLGKGKPTLSRLRSFDQAVVGRALPQLRRCVSHMPYKKESIPLRG
jgi:hypothetical protein